MNKTAIERFVRIIGAGRYSVSNMGRVMSYIYTSPKEIFGMNLNGYRRVELFMDNGKRVRVMVHRLVAQYFCYGMASELDVNHKDGNKGNNIAENLEWVTRKENTRHAFASGLMTISKGESCGRSKLSEADVKWIRKNHVPHKKGSAKGIINKYGICESNLRAILSRKSWRHI